ncbi:MAG: hypothetical protein A3I66_23030 [Burkholderiales bacterium RIFCSPLOWO2_02_FULL_57_36]|nr:MAG: hypothetical protein A3I66_23030 [Burkholderiales bacterium RIFCSPLOWO2_02_FULL_57_36]
MHQCAGTAAKDLANLELNERNFEKNNRKNSQCLTWTRKKTVFKMMEQASRFLILFTTGLLKDRSSIPWCPFCETMKSYEENFPAWFR